MWLYLLKKEITESYIKPLKNAPDTVLPSKTQTSGAGALAALPSSAPRAALRAQEALRECDP